MKNQTRNHRAFPAHARPNAARSRDLFRETSHTSCRLDCRGALRLAVTRVCEIPRPEQVGLTTLRTKQATGLTTLRTKQATSLTTLRFSPSLRAKRSNPAFLDNAPHIILSLAVTRVSETAHDKNGDCPIPADVTANHGPVAVIVLSA